MKIFATLLLIASIGSASASTFVTTAAMIDATTFEAISSTLESSLPSKREMIQLKQDINDYRITKNVSVELEQNVEMIAREIEAQNQIDASELTFEELVMFLDEVVTQKLEE